MENWFDSQTGLFQLDELVLKRDSFRKIMEDNYVSDDEVVNQSQLVLELLHKIDETLNESDKKLVADTLAELAVLFTVSQYHQLQEINNSKSNNNI